MQNKRTFIMLFSTICVVLNLVLGALVSFLNIPLIFMDTMGTIIAAIAYGPLWGAAVGLITNVVMGFLTNPIEIPFALVNVAIGIVTGLIVKFWGFSFAKAVITGIVLAIVAPLIGTPIAVWIYGGLTGGATDFLVGWLLASGQSIFTAAFIPRIAGNLIDKVASVLIAWTVIKQFPGDIKGKFTNYEA